MQYKIFLLILLLALPLAFINAQQHEDFKLPTRVVKIDTIVIYNGKPKASTLASNKPATKEKEGYKPVPLAGEKAYFGDMNDYVNQFVRTYLHAHNKTLSCVQDRGNTSFSLIDNVLQKNNIPKELKYLAVIESALNHNAVSHAGAVGPWQLMQSTARLMGLTVNRHRDDRRDWYKSTNAAAKYLSILYGQLNDWLLVIAAYNSGPAPVQRAIARTGSHNFWDIKKYLPHETQGHVLAFIATASIFENLSKFIGMGTVPLDVKVDDNGKVLTADAAQKLPKPQFTEEELKKMAIVRISEPLSMELLAKELNVDMKLLTKWNSDYELFEYNTYPSDYYKLRIPKDKLESFLQKKDYMTRKSKEIFNEMDM